MKNENIISFVKYGIDEKKTKDKMILGAIGVCALSMIACLDAWMYNLRTLICTIAVYFLSATYIIVLTVKSSKLSLKNRVVCDLIITTFTVSIFSLCAYLYLYMNEVAYSFVISLIPLLFCLVGSLYCLFKLHKGLYKNKANNPKYSNLMVFAAIGVALGTVIMENFKNKILSFISPDIIIGILFLIISAAFAIMGASSFLKLYYIRKLYLQGIDLED